ncbi:hypothetical protein MKX01_028038, partial [Papaver californicum]
MNMEVTLTSTHHSTLCIPSLLKQRQFLGGFNISSSFRSLSSSSARSKPVVSALEIGGVTIDKD